MPERFTYGYTGSNIVAMIVYMSPMDITESQVSGFLMLLQLKTTVGPIRTFDYPNTSVDCSITVFYQQVYNRYM